MKTTHKWKPGSLQQSHWRCKSLWRPSPRPGSRRQCGLSGIFGWFFCLIRVSQGSFNFYFILSYLIGSSYLHYGFQFCDLKWYQCMQTSISLCLHVRLMPFFFFIIFLLFVLSYSGLFLFICFCFILLYYYSLNAYLFSVRDRNGFLIEIGGEVGYSQMSWGRETMTRIY